MRRISYSEYAKIVYMNCLKIPRLYVTNRMSIRLAQGRGRYSLVAQDRNIKKRGYNKSLYTPFAYYQYIDNTIRSKLMVFIDI